MNEEFWDVMGKKYPRPFEGENFKACQDMIEQIKKFQISFTAKRLIDIGCGSGNYSLLFAKEAKEVFCLDSSKNMIDILADEVVLREIKNVSWIKSSFSDFDISQLKKSFDISFASMTPAVKSEEDLLKMEALAVEACIFIGWAGRRENKIVNEILSLHGIKPYSPKGFIEVSEILKKRGIKFKSKIFETSWNWSGSIEEAIELLSAKIKIDGKQPDDRLIKSILDVRFPSRKVEMTTFATQGMLIWKH